MIITLIASVILVSAVLFVFASLLLARRVAAAPLSGSPFSLRPHLAGGLLQARVRVAFAQVKREAPCRVSGLSMREAEDLLDWLEVTGQPRGQIAIDERSGFTVSWN